MGRGGGQRPMFPGRNVAGEKGYVLSLCVKWGTVVRASLAAPALVSGLRHGTGIMENRFTTETRRTQRKYFSFSEITMA